MFFPLGASNSHCPKITQYGTTRLHLLCSERMLTSGMYYMQCVEYVTLRVSKHPHEISKHKDTPTITPGYFRQKHLLSKVFRNA